MSVTVNECAAMRHLARDGWNAKELKMTFSLSTTRPVHKHVGGSCSHDPDAMAIMDWDGKTAPY